MDSWDLQNCDADDQIVAKICLKFRFLTIEQLQELLANNSDRPLIYAIGESGLLEEDTIAEIFLLKKRSVVCPKCEAINFRDDDKKDTACSECQTLISHTESSKVTTSSYTTRYGKYKILQKIGEGSVGVVYKAVQTNLDRSVALKVLKPTEIDELVLRRFKQEAKAIASLSPHPHIVGLFDIDESRGRHFIVMEYVEGKKLTDYIQNKSLSLEEIISITSQIADGLAHAHKHQIIHRDIKPDNIILTLDKTPKITDFGLARQLTADNRITQRNMIMGTPLYMAPEQAGGSPNIGYAADIYSLGVVLYEMLSGRPPFKNCPTLVLLRKIAHDPPPLLRQINPDVPETLESICMKALAKKSNDRFHSAEKFRDALRDFLRKYKVLPGKPETDEHLFANHVVIPPPQSPVSDVTTKNTSEQPLTDESPPVVAGGAATHRKIAPTVNRSPMKDFLEQKKREQKSPLFDSLAVDALLWGGLLVLVCLLIYKMAG